MSTNFLPSPARRGAAVRSAGAVRVAVLLGGACVVALSLAAPAAAHHGHQARLADAVAAPATATPDGFSWG
jgi:hypothetical protein